jgi:ribosomal protein S20
LAHSSRTWKGARTPGSLKRVRQTARKQAVNQSRRSETKTLVAKALRVATEGDAEQTRASVLDAVSALDKAAKTGVIHANAANRRKSRLMLKVNAALGGEALVGAAKAARGTGKAAAAKQARARVAASRAAKSKGEQTAAGKARAALSRSSRAERAAAAEAATETAEKPAKATSAKATPAKPTTRTAATKTTKAAAAKTTKAAARKPAAKAATTTRKAAPKKS